MGKLKPCLMCNNEDVHFYQDTKNKVTIKCDHCGLKYEQKFLRIAVDRLKDVMTEKWNNRPIKDQLDEANRIIDFYSDYDSWNDVEYESRENGLIIIEGIVDQSDVEDISNGSEIAKGQFKSSGGRRVREYKGKYKC